MKAKTIVKFAAFVGAAAVFGEICGTVGEIQAFTAMKKVFQKEVDEFIDAASDPEKYGITGPYQILKLKTIAAAVKKL